MKKKTVILLAVLILAAVCLFNSVYTVEENEYGCTVRLSKIISTTDEPGLHFKVPFLDSVKSFPKATMLYDIPPSEVLTADKQNMTVDCYVLWSVSDPLKFYQSLGNGAARNDIYEGITTSVDTLAANYGIKVEDVKIKRFDLPEANESAVYARMISERQQIAEKYTADGNYEASLIRNDVDKQVNIIVSNAEAEAAKLQAEGEAEYMRLLGKAYNTEDKQEFYKFTQALEALKSTLNGDEKTIILGKDSDLAQILMNP